MAEETAAWLTVAATSVAAAAMIVTAYGTIKMLRSRRREEAASKPTVSVSPHISKFPGAPHLIGFKIDDEHLTAWHIDSVSARPFWKRLLSQRGEPIRDGAGGTISYRPKSWAREIQFDPPTHSSEVLIRPDCPSRIDLVFRMSLRALKSESSRCDVRIKIRD